MNKRSLQASPTGQARAKQAIERKGWTQEYLAIQAGLSTRNSVWKFVTGRPIERNIFIELCFQLDLDWSEIAALPQNQPNSAVTELNFSKNLDEVLIEIKQSLQEEIQNQWSNLESSFDLTRSLRLEQIYTSVNILPRLSNQQWLEISDLQNELIKSDRVSLNGNQQKTIPALDAVSTYPKSIVLGKPDSAKTTFLKYLAIQGD
jgi:predicted NACHT family NTPase